jgi:hypothetical protein
LENKRAEQVLPRSVGGWWGGTMYTHVSKCKNDKIKKHAKRIQKKKKDGLAANLQ